MVQKVCGGAQQDLLRDWIKKEALAHNFPNRIWNYKIY
jgi:hypothetical protein